MNVEVLEDRTTPSATAIVSGVVFHDAVTNGVLDAGDPTLRGIAVSLVGTGASAGASFTTTTDTSGQFSFRSLSAGTYHLQAGPASSLSDTSETAQRDIVLADGQVLGSQNLAFHSGLSLDRISLALFLNTTTQADFPYGAPGATANHAPIASKTLGTMSLPQNTTGKVVDLAGFFTDPDYTNSQVRFNLSANGTSQSMLLNLFDAAAPQTVTNFFDQVNAGVYNNNVFHRKTTTAADGIAVLQGGGLTLNSTGNGFTLTPIGPSIPNEFGASNTANTIAMAQSGGDPNSANNQFYFNTASNAGQLDPQSFTVFGQLADAASQSELAALAATPTQNVTNTTLTHDFPPASFNQFPLNNYSGSSATFPGDATRNNFLVITSIDVVKRDEFLTYSLVSNSNSALVTASLNKEFLTLNAAPGQTGSATLTLRATDRLGVFVEQTLTVQLTAAPAVTAVTITPNIPANVTTLTANPTATPLNANPVTFAYQWLQNGFPRSGATSQTLNISTITVKPGDTFSVKVTPSELVGATNVTGAPFMNDLVTIATVSPITLVP
ncbi:MAG: peptidylprolyl isomerase [Gemmataceae bacterium]